MPPKHKLKIAFLYDDSLDGSEGVANQVKVLGGWLSERGHTVSYLVGQTALQQWHGGKVYSLSSNIKVRFNGNRLSIPLWASKSSIKQALSATEPDVLHVQMPHSPFLSQRVINLAADVPSVGTFHIFPASPMVRVGSSLLRLAYFGGLSKIAEVVSVSTAAQQFARDIFKLTTTVVPNMVNVSKFQSSEVTTVPLRVVFLGRLVERKGCRQLIEAFALVGQKVPEAKLIICGDGPQRKQLESLVARLGLSGSVEFKGYISDAERVQLLASAQIACFPSLHGESFGIVLIEAMAAGSGVVLAGNNPGYRSVMGDISQAMFNPDDKQQFADTILSFLGNEKLCQSVHSAQAKLVKKFDLNTVGPQIEALYQRAIDKTAEPRHN
jgi:phosphatidyl-myo-inositol alpha-mannosyltransferase